MEMTDHQIIVSLNRVQENIKKTMGDLASLKEEMLIQSQKEESSKVFKFIDDAKRVGFVSDLTIMQEFIEKKFSISKAKAISHLIDYIEFSASSTNRSVSPTQPPTVIAESAIDTSISQEPVVQPLKRKGPKPYSEMTPEELVIAKAAKASKMKKVEEVSQAESSSVSNTLVVKEKRVLTSKKSSDALKIWNSFLKIVQAEMESGGEKVKYDDVVKKAKEMKASDEEAYQLFSTTWTPEETLAKNTV